MSEFIVENVEIPMNQPNEDKVFKNVKELKIGDGTFWVKDGVLKIGNTTIIDQTGLNSLNNFQSDTLFDDTNRNPTNTTYEDVTGATLTSFTLNRQARILTYLRASMYHIDYNLDGSNFKTHMRLVDTFDNSVTDGISYGGNWVIDNINFGSSSWSSHVSSNDIVSISNDLYDAGTHQFKAQCKVDGGTGFISNFQIGYIILGI